MGQPLLNVSTASSAFHQNISVANFMHTFFGKADDTENFPAADVDRLRGVLKGVRVRIDHEQRVRAIGDIAPAGQTPSNVKFDNEGVEITVAKHLEDCQSTYQFE